MTAHLERSSMDALVAASHLPHPVLVTVAPTYPLGALTGGARQGLLDRRLVTAAILPLRYSKLGARVTSPARDVVDLTLLLDLVWICVTAGMAAPLLDVAVPAVDVAWLLAGPLGILGDSRDPVVTIASRLDPSLPVVTSASFGDLPQVLADIAEGRRATLYEARDALVDQWWLQPGRFVDLARLEVHSDLAEDELTGLVSMAGRTLGDDPGRWALAASLATTWPGSVHDLLAATRALGAPHGTPSG